MKRSSHGTVLLGLVLALVVMQRPAVMGQDPPDQAAAPAATDAKAQFDQVFGQWKDLLAKIREVRTKYNVSPPKDRPALEAEFKDLRAQGNDMVPKLRAAAEALYASAPAENADAADLLAQFAQDDILNHDDYEGGLKLAQLLIDHKYPKGAIYNVAGIAAFQMSDYDHAEQYFKEAAEKNALDETGRNYQAEIPELRELWDAEKKIRESEASADDLPRVLLKTNKGDIVVELFENEAPNTVANFINLVEKKFYDGLAFHRVLGGFMAQGGDPKGDGSGGPGYVIECECKQENHRNHFRGSLSMAKKPQPNTGGSQFFLTMVPTSYLNGEHTVFGRIVSGMDVLSKLQRRDPTKPNQPEPDKIVSAEVIRKRNHEYTPKTLPEA